MSEICFKDSGIEWIGKIPKHWEIWKLKYLARAYTGNSIKDEDKDFYTDPQDAIPYVATKDICRETQKCDYDNGLYIHNDDKNFKRAKKHSTLLCIEGGSAGKKLTYLNTNVCFVNKLCCIEALKGFNGKWLFYFLQSREFLTEFGLRLNGLIGGVSLEKLKRFYIPLPPLQEQETITRYLDEKTQAIDELISTHQKSIEKLKNYRASLISEVVTQGLDKNAKLKDSGIEWIGEIPKHWEIKKIKFVAKLNPNFKTRKEIDDKLEVSFLPMECLRTNKITPQVATLEEVESYTFFQENDILMAKVTPCFENKNIAKAVDLQNGLGFGTSEIYVLRCFDIFEDYLLYFLQGDIFSQKAISEMRGANGLKRIPANFMENFKIPLPPLQEQEAIAHYLDEKNQAIDELIATHQKSIEKLKNYRTSLISEAVTGKKNLQGINNGN